MPYPLSSAIFIAAICFARVFIRSVDKLQTPVYIFITSVWFNITNGLTILSAITCSTFSTSCMLPAFVFMNCHDVHYVPHPWVSYL